MIVNAFLLDQTLDYIEAHPEEWDQAIWRSYSCGTAACFAGHAALLSGARWLMENIDSYLVKAPKTAEITHVRTYATTVLGLTDSQADMLFWAHNSLDDLRVTVKLIKDGWDDDKLMLEAVRLCRERGNTVETT